jgi:hypothetical protein
MGFNWAFKGLMYNSHEIFHHNAINGLLYQTQHLLREMWRNHYRFTSPLGSNIS